jgi:hypothetical protein
MLASWLLTTPSIHFTAFSAHLPFLADSTMVAGKRRSGLSNRVKVRTGSAFLGTGKSQVIKVNKSAKLVQEEIQRRHDQIACKTSLTPLNPFDLRRIQAMSLADREHLMDDDIDMMDPDDMAAFHTVPPGEEGMFMAHAGGAEDLYEDIVEEVHPRYESCHSCVFSHFIYSDTGWSYELVEIGF